MDLQQPCPCGSNITYSLCCLPYHQGTLDAPSALILMRSRYSAYATKHVDYIIKTTHHLHPDQQIPLEKRKKDIETFCMQTTFKGLEILSYEEGESTSTVTFRAHLSQQSHDASFTEKSRFEKIHGQWRYLTGVIS